MNTIFLSLTARCDSFQVKQTVKVTIRFSFKLLGKLIDRTNFTMQRVFQLRALRGLITQAIIDSLQ